MLKRTFYILLLIISIKTYGQRTNSSPYSFFGIGQQYSSQSVEQASMGGVGVSLSSLYQLNFINPASFAHLRFATYTVGMNINNLTIKDNLGSQKSTSSSLSYVNLGFPVGENSAVAFGLKPNTSVGYSILNVNSAKTEATRFFGTGGTNKIYGAFGISVTKNIDLGIEAEYVFGKTENNILFQRVGDRLGTKSNEATTIKGAGVKFGLLYSEKLTENVDVSIGAAIKLENNLSTNGSEYLYSVLVQSEGFESPRDTTFRSSVSGSFKIPVRTIFGVGFGEKNKWSAAVDYQFQNALDVNGSLLGTSANYKFSNSSKIAIGGFYIPKINSISSYWQRITYRAGVRFENSGLLIKSSNTGGFTKIKDFGISFGLGLPLKDLSNLNLGIEYGKKGSTINNLIQENYFNFKLSLSLNAVGNLAWFKKRRID